MLLEANSTMLTQNFFFCNCRIQLQHYGSKLKRFWYYEPLWLKLEYNVDKNEIITSYLKQKLEFSGLFEFSLKILSNFWLKVVFIIAIARKNKNKSMMNRQIKTTRAQLFNIYVVKYHPNVMYFKTDFMRN